MANFNVIPFGLLGHNVSFRDLAFERHLSEFDLPSDYPEHLKSSVRTGVVQYIALTFNPKMEMSCEIVLDDCGYCLSEIDDLQVCEEWNGAALRGNE